MNIAVIFGSQRKSGTNRIIEDRLLNGNIPHNFEFIKMADASIEGCTACESCAKTGKCILSSNQNDMFNTILNKMIFSDAIFIISPVYAPIPSRLTALFERLLSISYFPYINNKIERPLKNKKTAIFSYDSGKIADDTQMKIIFQKFLMDDYSFFNVSYNYLNKVSNPNELYSDISDYVLDIASKL